MAGKTFNLSVIVSAIDRLSGPLGNMSAKLSKFGGAADAFGKKMSGMGKKLTTRLTLPLVGLGVAAAKTSFGLNEAMANVSTLLDERLGNVTNRTEKLKRGVQSMAISMGKDTGDIAEGLYQVVSAFGDASDNMEKLSVVAKAGVAGRATTVESLELLSAVTKGYGDTSVKALKKVSDLAFQTVKLGQTTFPELAAAIGRTVPLAAKLGIKQEELFAGFSTLTGVTGSAAEVSTQFAGIMRALIKPTDLMKKAINKLGYENGEMMVRQLGLVGSMKALNTLVKGNNEAWGKLTPRAEALTAIFSLTGETSDDFAKKLKAIENQSDSTGEAFRRQTKGIAKSAFAFRQLVTQIKTLGQNFGDILAPMIIKVGEKIGKFTKWFKGLKKETKEMIVKFALLAAALGPVLIIVGTMISAVGKIATGLKALRLLANPYVLLVLAIVAAIAIIVILLRKWEKRSKGVTRTIHAVVNILKKLKPIILTIMAVFAPFITLPILLIKNWQKVKDFFKKFDIGAKVGKAKDFFGGGEKRKSLESEQELARRMLQQKGLLEIKVTSDKSSTATVSNVKSKGMKLKVKSETYIGRTVEAH